MHSAHPYPILPPQSSTSFSSSESLAYEQYPVSSRTSMQHLTRASHSSISSMDSVGVINRDFGEMRPTGRKHVNLFPLPPDTSSFLPFSSPLSPRGDVSHNSSVYMAYNNGSHQNYSAYLPDQFELCLVRELESVARATWDERLVEIMRDYQDYTQRNGQERERFLLNLPQRSALALTAHDLPMRARLLMLSGLAHLSILYLAPPNHVMILLGRLKASLADSGQSYEDSNVQIRLWLRQFMCKHGCHDYDNEYGICVCGVPFAC
jgi:hypothetical protein